MFILFVFQVNSKISHRCHNNTSHENRPHALKQFNHSRLRTCSIKTTSFIMRYSHEEEALRIALRPCVCSMVRLSRPTKGLTVSPSSNLLFI